MLNFCCITSQQLPFAALFLLSVHLLLGVAVLRQQRPRSIVDVLEAVRAQLHSPIPADALWERDMVAISNHDRWAGSLK